MRNLGFVALSCSLSIPGVGPAYAQDYPVKPIRIFTGEPGGGNDFAARVISPELTKSLGRQVIVDSRGIFAIETVAKAPPDGYSLLLYAASTWLTPFMRDNTPWDPVRDFAPITMAMRIPNVLVVHPSLPVRNIRELIALAKSKPGQLNYSVASPGSVSSLGAELFKSMAGINIVRVPYKGTAQALNSLISGEVQMMISVVNAAAPHVKSGRLRALAVTSAQPSPLAPGLPTVAGTGLPGYESVSTYGMFVPSKTPEAIVVRLNQEIVRVLTRADIREKFFNAGIEAVGTSPEELAAYVKSEMARMGRVIRDAGIRGE